MTMSDAINGYEPEPYDVPRGTCPECGSRAVKHLVAGVPGSPEWTMGSPPKWVEGVGCCLPLHNRECRRCGLEWRDHPDDEL
jgi:hypothetical protein